MRCNVWCSFSCPVCCPWGVCRPCVAGRGPIWGLRRDACVLPIYCGRLPTIFWCAQNHSCIKEESQGMRERCTPTTLLIRFILTKSNRCFVCCGCLCLGVRLGLSCSALSGNYQHYHSNYSLSVNPELKSDRPIKMRLGIVLSDHGHKISPPAKVGLHIGCLCIAP